MRTNIHKAVWSLVLLQTVLVNASNHHRLVHDDQEIIAENADDFQGRQTAQRINDDDPVPLSTREHWMRRAKDALYELTGTPCPNQAFGTAIVNHTDRASDQLGDLVCIGANQVFQTGNPTLHGEMAAINNCTTVLGSPPYNLSPAEITAAWKDLSLYTTAEACSMCSSAINWAYFREYIYATSIWTQRRYGWDEIALGSRELLRRGGKNIRIVGPILEAEMDPLFGWQFQDGECPPGCTRGGEGQAKCVFER